MIELLEIINISIGVILASVVWLMISILTRDII